MEGTGTSGTMTGLDFTCRDVTYQMPGGDTCKCKYRVAWDFWGASRSFSHECSPKQCYKFVDYPGAPWGNAQALEDFGDPFKGGGKLAKYSVQAEALGSV
ncbi:unnamed protein product [Polarella glacialis]|uniref:Uncharacterized protein n=1 Tax=Polarella glacialis TaxID=89957 RepID=A0A813J3W2_POLGL|nr:unnamed protein product [Polarella glacialis]